VNQTPNQTPEVKRRRLRVALRQARETASLTQKQAATALDWSVSKIIRIEQGAVGVTPVDLRALLTLYGNHDKKQEAELVELARSSRKQPWADYQDVLTKEALTLFGSEPAASVIYKYESTFVPGLLQTEDYAKALLKALGHEEDKINRRVQVRLERQRLLDQKPRPQLKFILGEAAVRYVVGGPEVMLTQLEALKYIATRSGVSISILPFTAGAHPRMGEAFTILQFADDKLEDLLYLENAGMESISRDDPELIAQYLRDFVTIQDMAWKVGNSSSIDEIRAPGRQIQRSQPTKEVTKPRDPPEVDRRSSTVVRGRGRTQSGREKRR
jgi:transcriptional regulator with XRE-family HTH domain